MTSAITTDGPNAARTARWLTLGHPVFRKID